MTVGIAEAVQKRDRLVVIVGLAIIIVLAWVYIFYLASNMSGMEMEMEMAPAMLKWQNWGIVDYLLMFVMWSVMMVAMMTPSAIPMILLFSTLDRQRHDQQNPYPSTAIFLSGYLIVWIGFSAVATLAQWGLHTTALLSPMMVSTSPILSGVLLVGAGIFQFTPLKSACLAHCRSPLGFFMTEWREGRWGALMMGLRHGSFCVGCCWLLMALLFVAGVMNLLWVAIIAAYVLIEKVVPAGPWLSRAIGVLAIVGGAWLVVGTLF